MYNLIKIIYYSDSHATQDVGGNVRAAGAIPSPAIVQRSKATGLIMRLRMLCYFFERKKVHEKT